MKTGKERKPRCKWKSEIRGSSEPFTYPYIYLYIFTYIYLYFIFIFIYLYLYLLIYTFLYTYLTISSLRSPITHHWSIPSSSGKGGICPVFVNAQFLNFPIQFFFAGIKKLFYPNNIVNMPLFFFRTTKKRNFQTIKNPEETICKLGGFPSISMSTAQWGFNSFSTSRVPQVRCARFPPSGMASIA